MGKILRINGVCGLSAAVPQAKNKTAPQGEAVLEVGSNKY